MRSVIGQSPPGRSMIGESEFQFLATKVVSPRSLGLIERPRLLDTITQLPAKRLAVIKAPAGFGKTSLAAGWFERLRESGNSVAWLTIDPDDDEPSRFLLYVSQALQRACHGVGLGANDLINETFLISPRAIVSVLLNELMDVDEDVYLFLEDYHWITDRKIHESLVFFLTHAPSHCHVVLTTRTEPPIPLASLRARNQLLELDASALRFDLQETHTFIERENFGTLAPSEVKQLHGKTEGWPAALRIVVCTSQPGQDFGRYIRNLTGTQRPIGAYLAEMLDGLPGEMTLFMLRTAILDRLSAPLCEAVTGAGSSQGILASMEKRQLLLTPLDQEGRWYRYHPLLAEYLNDRLQSERGNELPGLHRRAALWCASQELWTDAVQHAIAAGDTDRALGWIKNCAMSLVKKGDLFTLLGWQRQLPSEMMRNQPEVRLAIAWGLALAMRFQEALQLLHELELDVEAEPPSDDGVFACECQAVRSVAIALKDDSQTALRLAQDCLRRSNDPWTANVATNVVRYGHLRSDLKKFYATPWIAYSLEENRRNVFASVYRRCLQGMAEAQQVRFDAANQHYLEGLRLAEQHVGPNSVAAALPTSLMARICYEQDRLEDAEALLIDRMPLICAGTMLDCVLSAYFVLAGIAAQRANRERAYALLEQAENQGSTRGWGRLSAAAVLERARLHLHEGRISEGIPCLDQLECLAAQYPASTLCAWSDIHRFTALVRAYLASAEERFDDAISILTDLQHEVEAAQNHYFGLRVTTLLSTVRLRANQVTEALASFRNVLTVSSAAGVFRTILDEGADVGPLLTAFQENAQRTGSSCELMPYVDSLIDRWRSRHQQQVRQSPRSSIVESLSTREGDILKLIAKGLSNKEIARSLAIAPETVKSHVKHIFTKLGVERRVQAVSRAQSLSLDTSLNQLHDIL
jgi:LuxR family transcriptional regulator, maltose regulon positive regulatory protein